MTKQEIKLNAVESRVSNLETKFEMFMRSFEDFKTELRDRDNRRAAEIMELRKQQEAAQAEIRQRQEAAQAKHDAEMHEMNQRFYAKFDAIDAKFDKMDAKIDGIGKHVQNITVAAMVGIGAAVIGIGAIAVAVVYSVFTR